MTRIRYKEEHGRNPAAAPGDGEPVGGGQTITGGDMEDTQDAERIRTLEAQVANLTTLVVAQERLIQEYQELVAILNRQA